MGEDLTRNTFIGLTTEDTLANLSSVITLLREMNFYDDVEEERKFGLFAVHTLIRNSLEYEIERLKPSEK
ncbi:hypothetical protein IMCC1989_2680 [gamma proteobacterium IMCC1989]|nr:hypothetical protein IMCC1989_2680 [gamma proteobacterium IMCC1989]